MKAGLSPPRGIPSPSPQPGHVLPRRTVEASIQATLSNEEGVPDAGNVRTWEKERHGLARERSGLEVTNNSGRFQLEVASDAL